MLIYHRRIVRKLNGNCTGPEKVQGPVTDKQGGKRGFGMGGGNNRACTDLSE